MCRQQACWPFGMAGMPCWGEDDGGRCVARKGQLYTFMQLVVFFSRILSHAIALTKLSEKRVPKKCLSNIKNSNHNCVVVFYRYYSRYCVLNIHLYCIRYLLFIVVYFFEKIMGPTEQVRVIRGVIRVLVM